MQKKQKNVLEKRTFCKIGYWQTAFLGLLYKGNKQFGGQTMQFVEKFNAFVANVGNALGQAHENVTATDPIYQTVIKYFDLGVNYLVLLIEIVGIAVLMHAVVSAIIGLFKKQDLVRLKLAEGIALSLEFKVGGELLRTVIVRDWQELGVLGAIILLRAALTFLIQWEIRIEKRNEELKALAEENDKHQAKADNSAEDEVK